MSDSNTLPMMLAAGVCRGHPHRQLAGLYGLVAKPQGVFIEAPIRRHARASLTTFAYLVTTQDSRQWLTNTALKVANSAYLLRRLVNVAQDVIILESDCGTHRGIRLRPIIKNGTMIETLRERILGRVVAVNLYHPIERTLIIPAGTLIDDNWAEYLERLGIQEAWVRSSVTCESRRGVCAQCYGLDLVRGHRVSIGEAIGIIAAQSIGEPATRLTINDSIESLTRIVELFEARRPKKAALLAEASGIIHLSKGIQGPQRLTIHKDNGERVKQWIPKGRHINVLEGARVEYGEVIADGELSSHDILRLKGVTALAEYLVQEIQGVYRLQGVKINDKHIEVIIRQMLRKVEVTAPGDTRLLRGDQVEYVALLDANKRAMAEGKQPALFEPLLLGITKASLATESFISAASFQETTRVLTEAAVRGSTDRLTGLTENVIASRLIPAGTGLSYHQERCRQRVFNSGKVEMTTEDLEQALQKALNTPEANE